ncbi:MAG: DNA gyrase subunit A [Candidatus Cloacimonadia bacterium]
MTEDKSRIINVEIEDELKRAYLEYSMSVIVSRALPDIRDGLKPSQRRIIYAMHELNLTPERGFRKCAKIAGDTSGNYHPHGEQVIYPTLVRMAQPWNLRYTLVNGQGNFGSIDGDPPAAMRYTEAKMQKIATELLVDIEKDTVDFRSNYDETRTEPTIFPTRIPNLLVNGSSGIAVGMATNMPPHNMGEVCDALIAYIDDRELTPLEIMDYIKGPDFPTGGYILGRASIIEYFQTGYGKVRVRGKAEVEERANGGESIIISEIPYQVNKTVLIDRIVSLVKEKRIEGISDIRDESGRDGMRLVIEVKRNEDAQVVLNQLYKFTQLQDTFGVINLALVNGEPKVLSITEMLDHFIEFRHEVVTRRTQFELDNAEKRLHILEGLRIALENIDEVIQTIKESKSTPEANEKLQAKFSLSEIQAKAILEMRLQRLTGLERDKIEQEYQELLKTIAYLREILGDINLRMSIIKDEIKEIKKQYADERRSEIVDHITDLDMEDLITEEEMVVTISHEGYIKRMPVDTYRQQRRGGKGLSATNLKDNDFIEKIFVASTHAYILFFSNFGKCYWLKVYELPLGSRQARGKAIVNLLPLEEGDKIKAYVAVREFDEDHFLTMVTKKGTIKKTTLEAYSRPRSSGIIAIKLIEGDELIDAQITEGDNDIILATRHGYANRFSETNVRAVGRNSQGVRGINLREDDYVVSMVVLRREEGTLLAISENGFGKRSPQDEYVAKNRGTKGVITIKTTKRNGYLVALLEVVDGDDLITVTKDGMIIRQPISDIKVIGRNTQGVTLISLNKGDKVFDVACVTEEKDDEDDQETNGNNTPDTTSE